MWIMWYENDIWKVECLVIPQQPSSADQALLMPQNCRSDEQDAQIPFCSQMSAVSLKFFGFPYNVFEAEISNLDQQPSQNPLSSILTMSDSIFGKLFSTLHWKKTVLAAWQGSFPVWVLVQELWCFQSCWRKITAELSVFLDSSLHVWAEVLPDCLGIGAGQIMCFPHYHFKNRLLLLWSGE